MADEFVNNLVFDEGLNHVKNAANVELRLVDGYVKGSDLTTVQGITLAKASLSSGEMVISNITDGRVLTIAGGKSLGNATSTSGASPDLGWAITSDTTGEVYLVADSTSSEQITTGNPITMSTATTFPGNFA